MNIQIRILSLLQIVAIPVFLAGLSSCGSVPTAAKVSSAAEVGTDDHAVLYANSPGKPAKRIGNGRVISLNGQPATGGSVDLTEGLNTVGVAFDWGKGREQVVELKFRALEGRRYFVRYQPSNSTAASLSSGAPHEPIAE